MRLARTWKTGDASSTSPWWRSFVTRTLRTEAGLSASGTTARRYRKMWRMVAQPAADPRAAIREEVRRVAGAPGADVEAIFRLGGSALQYGMSAEADAMFAVAVRVLHHFIARRDAPNALAVEGAIYNTFVKAVESEDHYERAFSQWRDAMVGLGRSFAPSEERTASPGGPGVAFVFHTGTVLGHTEVLFRLLGAR